MATSGRHGLGRAAEELTALVEAIRHLHGCEALWVESVPVHEAHEGRTVWDREVQVFDLVGPPKGRKGLCLESCDHGHQAAVRRSPGPISCRGRETAVQASMVAAFRKTQS